MAKTKIKVVSCFDGGAEAVEVFSDLIARKMAGRRKEKFLREKEENAMESGRGCGYNKGRVPDPDHAPGLCR